MENPQLDKLVVRTDPLTGCKNLIAFAEEVYALCSLPSLPPFALVTLDVNHMDALNRMQGHAQGDSVLRWIALLAQDALGANFFRIGGDEFVAILTEKTLEQCDACAQDVFERLNARAGDFALLAPIASMSVIHFTGAEDLAPVDIFARIYGAIVEVKKRFHRTFQVFHADAIDSDADLRILQMVTNRMIERVIYLGSLLDESLELAFTDAVTGLPNLRLAQRRLGQMLASAAEAKHFALLLIDGDDLRRYNEISYAEGDAMIHNLGQVIRQALRPDDFLARWKVGDEFIVLLRGVEGDGALAAGERICIAVQEASRQWKLPVTVSIGVAVYPEHGQSSEALIRCAEIAYMRSKRRGKNRVTLYTGVDPSV